MTFSCSEYMSYDRVNTENAFKRKVGIINILAFRIELFCEVAWCTDNLIIRHAKNDKIQFWYFSIPIILYTFVNTKKILLI